MVIIPAIAYTPNLFTDELRPRIDEHYPRQAAAPMGMDERTWLINRDNLDV